jgi:NAD(P)H-hydrate repair Nnr-like enzyme with NAD(P)H-hydrate dehydratase domain
VLTGVTAAFLAKSVEPRWAAVAAAVAHGEAARLAEAEVGGAGMTASDLLPALSRTVSREPSRMLGA